MVKGISASKGIAIAKAYKLEIQELKITKKQITNPQAEMKRLEMAIELATRELKDLYEQTLQTMGEEEAKIFEAHLLLVKDPELLTAVKQIVFVELVNIEYALKKVRDQFVLLFKQIDDKYMKERASDIADVTNRLLALLLGVKANDLSFIKEEVILIANDLTPSHIASIQTTYVKGIITNVGGSTSHSAIMARSLEIPAVVGTRNITEHVESGDIIILDALNGEVIIRPTSEQIKYYRQLKDEYDMNQQELKKLINQPTITIDKERVELAANISTPQDLKSAINNGAEAIGLFRTEFLYMNHYDFPTEEEQFNAYKEVLSKMKGKKVVIRTLDIGGDKQLSYIKIPKEDNPVLGYRAIRLCLDRKNIFKTQLRALLRASIYGKLAIMFPMIATIQEFNEAKLLLLEVKQQLIAEGIKVSEEIEVGIMIEVPAAAILADQFAKVVDFFSIGTNDLIQYTFASDRMNEQVSYLYQPLNPSILRLIKLVIDAAHKENKWVGMCGEMASDELAIPILLGLGLDEFSVSPTSILKTRYLIQKLSKKEMEKLAHQVIQLSTSEAVINLVKEKIKSFTCVV